MFGIFKSRSKEEILLDAKIDSVWDRVRKEEYIMLQDYLKSVDELMIEYESIKFVSEKVAFLTLKRITLLYQMLSLLVPPDGLKVTSFFLKNQGTKKRLGYLFNIHALKQYRLHVKWSNRLLDEARTVKAIKDYVVVESLEPLNNLAYLANIIYDLDTKEILLEKNPKDAVSKLAYIEIKEGN